jgi:putrescine transport system substrate-binding protein
LLAAPAVGQGVVHVYNWNDYIDAETVAAFEAETGIKVVYDVFDSNEVLEAKLLAGSSGYDVVFPSAYPYLQRQIQAGLYQQLDRSKLPNMAYLDPLVMKANEAADPGHLHALPYLWGTTGIGVNLARVREILGEDAELDTWSLLFDPQVVSKLAACGVTLLDEVSETVPVMLLYLGLDPQSADQADLDRAAEAFKGVRPHIKYFHSSQYVNDLANGDICVAHGYSGDILQAADRAAEAGKGVEISYLIPREGAPMWTDMMAVPTDAPHPEEAHAFINYLLTPAVIAAISDYVYYANPNLEATALVDEELRADPGIYPTPRVKERLFVVLGTDAKSRRRLNRFWTRVKTGT